MLIGMRNAMLAKRLPYDAEVEYLESSGTQWIDTAVQTADKVQMGVWVNITGGDMKIWGNSYYLGKWVDISWHQSLYRGTQIPQVEQTWDTLTIEKSPKKLTVERGGETFSTNSWWAASPSQIGGVTTCGTAVPLFGHISPYGTSYGDNIVNGWGNTAYHLRISFFKSWSNGVLVRDFIPVRKGTVGYLYDRVSGKLFGNAGTGDFVLGPDVVPVEYIESHGTEWIDTGFKTTSDSTIEISAAVSNFVKGNLIFGSKGTDETTLIRLLEYIQNEVSILSLQSGAFGVTAGGYITADTNFHKYLITPSGASIDDSIGYQKSRTSNTETNFVLFAYVSATDPNNRLYSQSKIAYAKILQGTTPVRSFRPIRVGTDATSWEGAMMDVLTRRIYRNEGTGAFTYGNDLKYPIPAE